MGLLSASMADHPITAATRRELPAFSTDFADLLQWLLQKHPAHRPTWPEVLSHPFWNTAPPPPALPIPDQPTYREFLEAFPPEVPPSRPRHQPSQQDARAWSAMPSARGGAGGADGTHGSARGSLRDASGLLGQTGGSTGLPTDAPRDTATPALIPNRKTGARGDTQHLDAEAEADSYGGEEQEPAATEVDGGVAIQEEGLSTGALNASLRASIQIGSLVAGARGHMSQQSLLDEQAQAHTESAIAAASGTKPGEGQAPSDDDHDDEEDVPTMSASVRDSIRRSGVGRLSSAQSMASHAAVGAGGYDDRRGTPRGKGVQGSQGQGWWPDHEAQFHFGSGTATTPAATPATTSTAGDKGAGPPSGSKAGHTSPSKGKEQLTIVSPSAPNGAGSAELTHNVPPGTITPTPTDRPGTSNSQRAGPGHQDAGSESDRGMSAAGGSDGVDMDSSLLMFLGLIPASPDGQFVRPAEARSRTQSASTALHILSHPSRCAWVQADGMVNPIALNKDIERVELPSVTFGQVVEDTDSLLTSVGVPSVAQYGVQAQEAHVGNTELPIHAVFHPVAFARLPQPLVEAHLTAVFQKLSSGSVNPPHKLALLAYCCQLAHISPTATAMVNSSLMVLWLRMLQKSRNEAIRFRATVLMAVAVRYAAEITDTLATEGALDALQGCLQDDSPRVRRAVTALLGELLFFVSVLPQDPSSAWAMPGWAAMQLRKLMDASESDNVVRHYAAKTLENILAQSHVYGGKFASQTLAGLLYDMACSTVSAGIRATAIHALAHTMRLNPGLRARVVAADDAIAGLLQSALTEGVRAASRSANTSAGADDETPRTPAVTAAPARAGSMSMLQLAKACVQLCLAVLDPTPDGDKVVPATLFRARKALYGTFANGLTPKLLRLIHLRFGAGSNESDATLKLPFHSNPYSATAKALTLLSLLLDFEDSVTKSPASITVDSPLKLPPVLHTVVAPKAIRLWSALAAKGAGGSAGIRLRDAYQLAVGTFHGQVLETPESAASVVQFPWGHERCCLLYAAAGMRAMARAMQRVSSRWITEAATSLQQQQQGGSSGAAAGKHAPPSTAVSVLTAVDEPIRMVASLLGSTLFRSDAATEHAVLVVAQSLTQMLQQQSSGSGTGGEAFVGDRWSMCWTATEAIVQTCIWQGRDGAWAVTRASDKPPRSAQSRGVQPALANAIVLYTLPTVVETMATAAVTATAGSPESAFFDYSVRLLHDAVACFLEGVTPPDAPDEEPLDTLQQVADRWNIDPAVMLAFLSRSFIAHAARAAVVCSTDVGTMTPAGADGAVGDGAISPTARLLHPLLESLVTVFDIIPSLMPLVPRFRLVDSVLSSKALPGLRPWCASPTQVGATLPEVMRRWTEASTRSPPVTQIAACTATAKLMALLAEGGVLSADHTLANGSLGRGVGYVLWHALTSNNEPAAKLLLEAMYDVVYDLLDALPEGFSVTIVQQPGSTHREHLSELDGLALAPWVFLTPAMVQASCQWADGTVHAATRLVLLLAKLYRHDFGQFIDQPCPLVTSNGDIGSSSLLHTIAAALPKMLPRAAHRLIRLLR